MQHALRADGGGQGFGLLLGRLWRKMSEDNSELVAADAADNIGLAGLADQRLADGAQDGVASRMAVRVVDLLEVVEVEIDEARLDLVTLYQGDDARGFPHESAAVVD